MLIRYYSPAAMPGSMLCLMILLLLPTTLALNTRKLQQEKAQTGLLQKSSQGRAKTPVPANFFDDFDQGESTINEAFYSNIDFPGHIETKLPLELGAEEQFFVETPSAGAKDAWQTYPGLNSVPANRGASEGTWLHGEAGYWQKYTGSKYGFGGSSTSANDASWFDSMTENYNGLGQPQLPPFNDATLLRDVLPGQEWVQRAVNTTLTCQAANCTALAALNVYDAELEEVDYCRLNIDVHPTDYDNEETSHEFIRYFKVNDHMASGRCKVHKLMGCNASAWRPLVPCVQDLSVDHLLSNGSLVLESQINDMVDECPYEGNLLSAVAMVTCMARSKPGFDMQKGTRARPIIGGDNGGTFGVDVGSVAKNEAALINGSLNGRPPQRLLSEYEEHNSLLPGTTHQFGARMSCGSPGCAARTLMTIDTQVLRTGASCLMNFSLIQTDFDQSVENDVEQIEFLNVTSLGAIVTNVQPGRNPCTEEYSSGTKLSTLDKVYELVTNQNVTDAIRAEPFGLLVVEGKISRQVDDCASNGSFLDGHVLVECTIPAE